MTPQRFALAHTFKEGGIRSSPTQQTKVKIKTSERGGGTEATSEHATVSPLSIVLCLL